MLQIPNIIENLLLEILIKNFPILCDKLNANILLELKEILIHSMIFIGKIEKMWFYLI